MQASPRAFYQILRLHQLVATCMDDCLLPVQLTAHQYTVLSLVRRYAPTTSAELARQLQVSAQSMGESLKPLDARGLISRGSSNKNKRVVTLQLTLDGKKTLQMTDKLISAAETAFFTCLDEQLCQSMDDAIRVLRAFHSESSHT